VAESESVQFAPPHVSKDVPPASHTTPELAHANSPVELHEVFWPGVQQVPLTPTRLSKRGFERFAYAVESAQNTATHPARQRPDAKLASVARIRMGRAV
jgi:hypothetical protein